MLTQTQVDFYNENGYLLVEGLFTPAEAAVYRAECHELANRLMKMRNIDATWGAARTMSEEAKSTAIYHCHDVQFYSAAFSKMIVDDRFTEAASQILGSPNVQLHHTKMFIKPPEKGSPFPMHQDWTYFPHRTDSMVAAIVHFDDATEEKGCVAVYPGSHKLGRLEQNNASGGWVLDPEEWSLEKATKLPAKAGDVLFFSYLTVHGSGINRADEARTTVLVQLRDPSDCPAEDVHKSWGQGQMLRGIDPTSANGLTWATGKSLGI